MQETLRRFDKTASSDLFAKMSTGHFDKKVYET